MAKRALVEVSRPRVDGVASQTASQAALGREQASGIEVSAAPCLALPRPAAWSACHLAVQRHAPASRQKPPLSHRNVKNAAPRCQGHTRAGDNSKSNQFKPPHCSPRRGGSRAAARGATSRGCSKCRPVQLRDDGLGVLEAPEVPKAADKGPTSPEATGWFVGGAALRGNAALFYRCRFFSNHSHLARRRQGRGLDPCGPRLAR